MFGTVLVVDDMAGNSRLFVSAPHQTGTLHASLTTATNRCARFTSAACDLVLINVMAPNIDGFDACRAIKPHVDRLFEANRCSGPISTSRSRERRFRQAVALLFRPHDALKGASAD